MMWMHPGLLKHLLILLGGTMKHQGDLHNLYFEKDNVLYSSLDLFTFVPVYNTMSKQEEFCNP